MNRRSFLKRAFAIAAVTVIAPTTILPIAPIANAVSGGVSNSQLQELIAATLKDMPKGLFERAFDQPTWQLTDIYRSKQ